MSLSSTRHLSRGISLLAPLALLLTAGCDPHEVADSLVEDLQPKPDDRPGQTPPSPPRDGGVNPCATVLCAPDHFCVVLRSEPPQATCQPKIQDPCATVRCAAGTHCQVRDVQCVREPCRPQPTCVPDAKPACDLDCARGTHCELKQVQCVRAPCPPQPTCVADGVKCGSNSCGPDEYCCNASCGICAPKNGACIQIACE